MPSSSRKPFQPGTNSAFTPVKGNDSVERSLGGRLQGPSRLGNNDDRRLSVTFQRGTKGDLNNDNYEESGESMAVDDNEMDGSYLPPNCNAQFSSLADSSTQSTSGQIEQLDLDNSDCIIQHSIPGEKEDDDDLFIRSPIGGIRLTDSSINPSAQVSRFLFSGSRQSNDKHSSPHLSPDSDTNTSSLGLRALSQTSTPGFPLKHIIQTPGPITPIEPLVHGISSKLLTAGHSCSDIGTPLASKLKVTLSPKGLGGGDDSCDIPCHNPPSAVIPEVLPDSKEIFGLSFPTRPVPGISVAWPVSDLDSTSSSSSPGRVRKNLCGHIIYYSYFIK